MNNSLFIEKTQSGIANSLPFTWQGDAQTLAFDESDLRACLLNFHLPVWAVSMQGNLALTNQGNVQLSKADENDLAAWLPQVSIDQLGDPSFCSTYGVKAACYAGGMANAIACEEMLIALAKAGLMGSFGSGGISSERLEAAIQKIQSAIPNGEYLFNLIHNPFEPALEQQTIDTYLKYGVRAVEAAAFIRLSPAIIQYRASGLELNPSGDIYMRNRIIAKISRKEIAQLFMQPAPENMLQQLLAEGRITAEQARLAAQVPMADDITVEADSGGHTDNRPLVSLLPSIIALRDQIQAKYQYKTPIRVGAGGGISTPESALAAFVMGAAYIVTGSVNQACLESGACENTKALLAQAAMADVTMAPSADMFEMGARVQVLKKGTLFPMRAQKLYELYSNCESIEDIPAQEVENLETKIFQRSIPQIWQETVDFFSKRDPQQIAKAEGNPKRKMALIFRWYLGLSSRWARDGVEERKMDYQIWCGPSIGAFNEWTKGSYLEDFHKRHVADVNLHILTGCAYLWRVQQLKMQGVHLPQALLAYRPQQPLISGLGKG